MFVNFNKQFLENGINSSLQMVLENKRIKLDFIAIFFISLVFLMGFVQALEEDVVINEFESNPTGANTNNQWIELYNNGSVEIDISGWRIYDGQGSGAPQTILTIPANTIILNKSFYTRNTSSALMNSGWDFLTLRNATGVKIDETSNLTDSENDNFTWQRSPNTANNWVLRESTRNFTNNLIYIENKTTSPMCILETSNVTLSANITGSCINGAIFSVFLNESWINFTGIQTGNTYSATIPSELIPSFGFFNWTVYAIDCTPSLAKNGDEIFKVNSITYLEIDPALPTGINGWYISEPEFSLINSDGNISYNWNGDAFQNYTYPFGLEDTPNNGNITGGIHILRYKSDICQESQQEFMGKFDLTNPLITNLLPEEGTIIYSTQTPTIEAFLDEIYQSNSGINKSSVVILLDGTPVSIQVLDSGILDAIARYEPNSSLTEGLHIINLSVSDNSGRYSSKLWNFTISISAGLNLTINQPEEKIYDTKRIPFNLTTENEVGEILYINHNDKNPIERRLCRNCHEYGETSKKIKTLNEGQNNITFIAKNGFENIEEKNISLFIDSKNPKIIKVEPRIGFTSGEFLVEFIEDNPQELILYYGNDSLLINKTLDIENECILEKTKQKCQTQINLSDFDEQEIIYWFELKDILGSIDFSKERKLKVDTTNPFINSWNYSINQRKVEFTFNITEKNFDYISYTDLSDLNPRERKLCSRLKNNVCEVKRDFVIGNHNLTINILDEAGNFEEVFVDFTII